VWDGVAQKRKSGTWYGTLKQRDARFRALASLSALPFALSHHSFRCIIGRTKTQAWATVIAWRAAPRVARFASYALSSYL